MSTTGKNTAAKRQDRSPYVTGPLGVRRAGTKEPPWAGSELTSLFGAEAGDRTGPLGALWRRVEAVQRNAKFWKEILALLPSPNHSYWKE